MRINLNNDERNKYYSQLNNQIDPYIACQVTAMVMGLDMGGFGISPISNLECSDFKQPEDKLRSFLLNDKNILKFCKQSHPDSKLPPPEWADVMCYAINKLYGKNITFFYQPLNMSNIVSDLQSGFPTYTSMRYPDNTNFSGKVSPIAGHIVLIVGIDESNIYINDPYKNHLTGEKDGFNNKYTFEEFNAHNKGYAIRYRNA